MISHETHQTHELTRPPGCFFKLIFVWFVCFVSPPFYSLR